MKNKKFLDTSQGNTFFKNPQSQNNASQANIQILNGEEYNPLQKNDSNKNKYFDFFNDAPIGCIMFDRNGSIDSINKIACHLMNDLPTKLIGTNFLDFVVESDKPLFKNFISSLNENQEITTCSINIIPAHGLSINVKLTGQAQQEKHQPLLFKTIITEVQNKEDLLPEKDTIIKIIEYISNSKNLRELMKATTSLLRQWSGCDAIGIRLNEGEDYPYYETRGFPEEFVLAETRLCEVDSNGNIVRDHVGNAVLECMCGNILRGRFDPSLPFFTENGSFWSNCTTELLRNTNEEDRQARTRNRCNGEGYESVALIPLRYKNFTFGLLQLNDKRVNRFTLDKIHTIEKLATSLAIVLHHHKIEQALQKRESEYQQLINNIPDVLYSYSKNRGMIYCSDQIKYILGYPAEQFNDNPFFLHELLLPEDKPIVEKAFKEFSDEKGYTLEYRIHDVNGDIHWFFDRSIGKKSNGDEIIINGLITDITFRKQAERSIQISEERFRTISGLISDYAYSFRVDNQNQLKLEWITEAFFDITGFTPEESEARGGWATLIHPDDIAIAITRKETLFSGQDDTSEFRIIRKDGSIKWIRDYGRPIWDERNRQIKRIIGAVQDITEFKKAEEALFNARRDWEEIFQAIGHPILILDENYNILEANRATSKAVNMQKSEIIGKKCHEIFHLSSHPAKLCPLERMKKSNELITTEMEIEALNGTYLVSLTPVLDKNKNLKKIIHIATDITEQKRIKDALQESESKYRQLIEQSNDAIYVLFNNKFILINDKFRSLLGYTLEEMQRPDFSLFNLVAPKSIDYMKEREQKIKNNEIIDSRYEFTALSKEGKEIEIEVTVSNIKYNNGSAIQGILRDITERKQLEHHFREVQKMEAIGNLAGGVAHDFNNLLTAIIGNSELILENIAEDNPIRFDVNEIKKAANRAADLTQQLLAYSRRQPLKFDTVDLNDNIKKIISFLKRIIGPNITLKTKLLSKNPFIYADQHQITQLIINLVINAKDAISEKGTITISTKNVTIDENYCKEVRDAKPGTFISLTIEDNGAGIEKSVLRHIFEPFFTTKVIGKGTGLGLSAVYGITRQHKGWIITNSEVGKGSIFQIFLPTLKNEHLSKNPAIQTDKALQGKGENILLIEDEEVVRIFISKMLGKKGFTVISAENAETATKIFNEKKDEFDLILSDIILPDCNGLKLIKEFLSQRPDLKVIFSSGYPDHDSAWPSIQTEHFKFISKPYSFPDLLNLIRQTLDA